MEYWPHFPPFPSCSLSFCWVWGRAERPCWTGVYCKTQTNGPASLSIFPANADALGASAWVGCWQVLPPVPKYLRIPTPPLRPWDRPCPLPSQHQWTADRPKRYVAEL